MAVKLSFHDFHSGKVSFHGCNIPLVSFLDFHGCKLFFYDCKMACMAVRYLSMVVSLHGRILS